MENSPLKKLRSGLKKTVQAAMVAGALTMPMKADAKEKQKLPTNGASIEITLDKDGKIKTNVLLPKHVRDVSTRTSGGIDPIQQIIVKERLEKAMKILTPDKLKAFREMGKEKKDRNVKENLSEEEIYYLAWNNFYEARSESYEGRLAVLLSVLDRMTDPKEPSTAMGVIFKTNQYSWTHEKDKALMPGKLTPNKKVVMNFDYMNFEKVQQEILNLTKGKNIEEIRKSIIEVLSRSPNIKFLNGYEKIPENIKFYKKFDSKWEETKHLQWLNKNMHDIVFKLFKIKTPDLTIEALIKDVHKMEGFTAKEKVKIQDRKNKILDALEELWEKYDGEVGSKLSFNTMIAFLRLKPAFEIGNHRFYTE